MKSSTEKLKSRGYIDELDLIKYIELNKCELLVLLNSNIAFERTVAVRRLSEYHDDEILNKLIDRLLVESKLYTKIALTEEISKYGELASAILVKHLGKVGKNQHKVLPDKPFEKNSYPLPRDIIARTMCKIGMDALPSLKSCIYHGSYAEKIEAIDAIGFVSFYEGDASLKDDILNLYFEFSDDDLMVWKILRSMQSFDSPDILEVLNKYKKSNVIQHEWEALRSLEQIKRSRIK